MSIAKTDHRPCRWLLVCDDCGARTEDLMSVIAAELSAMQSGWHGRHRRRRRDPLQDFCAGCWAKRAAPAETSGNDV